MRKRLYLLSLFVGLVVSAFAQKQIGQYEYWFDDNVMPKTATSVAPVSSFQLNTTVPTTVLPAGLHTFQIRFKETTGVWSSPTTQFFVRLPIVINGQKHINQYEYWFDNDYAGKTLKTVTSQTELAMQLSIPTNLLPIGLHTFQIRFQDVAGVWSSTTTQFFVKQPNAASREAKVVKYEFWFDTDYGKKTEQSVSPQKDLSLVSALSTNTLTVGLHTFQIRFQEATGAWSSTTTQFFVKQPDAASREAKVVKYEYWFDADYGKKTEQLVSPQKDLSLVSALFTNTLTVGLHTFQIRFQEATGVWSSTTTQFFVKPKGINKNGNKISAYRYWFDKGFEKQTTVIVDSINPLILTNQVIPVTAVKVITPNDYEFKPYLDSIRITYKSPSILHMQFKDIVGQWSTTSNDTVRFRYTMNVTCDTLQSRVPKTKTVPSMDAIHFYSVNVLVGDSLIFKTNIGTVIDLYDPYGKKLKTIISTNDSTVIGTHAKLNGIYYALVHGFNKTSETYTIAYTHIAKYEIISYNTNVIGSTGTNTITFIGNGFDKNTALKIKGALNEIIPDTTYAFGLSRLNTVLALNNVPEGKYDLIVTFGNDTTITIKDGLSVVPTVAPELEIKLLGSAFFLAGSSATYTAQIINKGNVTAYNVPLTIRIKCDKQEDIPFIRIESDITRLNDEKEDSTSDAELNRLIRGTSGVDKNMFLPVIKEDGLCYLTGDFLIPQVAGKSSEDFVFTISKSVHNIDISAYVPKNWNFYKVTNSDTMHVSRTKLRIKSTAVACCMLDAVNCYTSMVTAALNLPSSITDCVTDELKGYLKESVYKQLFCDGKDITNWVHTPRSFLVDIKKQIVDCAKEHLAKDVAELVLKQVLGETAAGFIIKIYEVNEGCKDFVNDGFGSTCGSGASNGGMQSSSISSYDPNDKYGFRSPSGSRYFKGDNSNFTYVINFENKKSASAPAHDVYVTDTLNRKVFNIHSFRAGYIKIGNKLVQAPFNAQSNIWEVDMRPAMNLRTEVKLTMDTVTGIARWYFKSIDPLTGESSANPFVGFLPPNDSIGSGQGCVSFSIDLNDSIQNGNNVNNRASIVFDYNDQIMTPTWSNTKDVIAPVSTMSQPTIVSDSIATLSWIGEDNKNGSGVYRYNVYAKKANEAYSTLLGNTSLNSIDFKFDRNADYAFYVTATDSAGNIEFKNIPDITLVHTITTLPSVLSSIRRMNVFPNPSTNGLGVYVTFNMPDQELKRTRLVITSMLGSVVKEVDLTGNKIHLEDIGTGIFIFDLRVNGESVEHRKVVIQ